MVQPDLAGFADAQERLRGGFGELVTFRSAPSETYPPGTPLDPETGKPYDVTIVPTASGASEWIVRCDVAFRAINRAGIGGDSNPTPVGLFEESHVLLIANSAAASAAASAVEFSVRGDTFKITSRKFDGVGAVQRHLTYGRKE